MDVRQSRTHITVRSGIKSSQTTLKRRKGRLFASKGSSRVSGPSVSTTQRDRAENPSQIDIEAAKATNSRTDASSCPSTPSILQGFSDNFDISSDFDLELPAEYQELSTAEAAGSKHARTVENENRAVPTKRLRVRVHYLFEGMI